MFLVLLCVLSIMRLFVSSVVLSVAENASEVAAGSGEEPLGYDEELHEYDDGDISEGELSDESDVVEDDDTPLAQQSLTPLVQQNLTPLVQQNLTPLAQQNLTPLPQQNLTPLAQQNLTPLAQQSLVTLPTALTTKYLNPYIPLWQAIILILSIAFLSFLVSLIYGLLRNTIFMDWHIIDTFFDSGGNVNATLMSCFVVTRWLWIGVITAVTASFKMADLAGHAWYSISGCIPIFLSTVFAFRIRIIAPGAKTFLQVIKARFGTHTHLLTIGVALTTNFLLGGMILSETTRIATALCQEFTGLWMCAYLICMAGTSAIISGLGGSLYFSYCVCTFTSSVLLVYLYELTFSSQHYLQFANLVESNNSKGGNFGIAKHSLMSIGYQSSTVMVYAVIRLISGLCMTVTDQSFWMSAIASKPSPNFRSHMLGGMSWLMITFSMSFIFGIVTISSLASSPATSGVVSQLVIQRLNTSVDGTNLDDLLPAYASQQLLGRAGDYLMFCLSIFLFLAGMVPQLLSVASIIVYDIAMTYFKPTYHDEPLQQQGKDKPSPAEEVTSAFTVKGNEKFFMVSLKKKKKRIHELKQEAVETPVTSGDNENARRKIRLLDFYLERQKYEFWTKNLAIALSSIFIFALSSLFYIYAVDSSWIMVLIGIVSGSSLVPIFMTYFWTKTSSAGVFLGIIFGFMGSFGVWIALTISYRNIQNDLFTSSGEPNIALIAQCTSVIMGAAICTCLSLICRSDEIKNREVVWKRNRSSGIWWYRIQMDDSDMSKPEDEESVWPVTLAIDSPLISWLHLYAEDLEGSNQDQSTTSYTTLLQTLNNRYKHTRLASYSIPTILSLFLMFLWPIVMFLIGHIPTTELLKTWKALVILGSTLSAVYLTIFPLVAEVVTQWRATRRFSAWKRRHARTVKLFKDKLSRKVERPSGLEDGMSKSYDFRFVKKWNRTDYFLSTGFSNNTTADNVDVTQETQSAIDESIQQNAT